MIKYINRQGEMSMYNIYQLRKYADKFLKDNYNMKLTVPLQLNGRMKRTCGWFKYTNYRNGRKEAKVVELNKFFVENNDPTVVLDVLRHELTHYALFMQGKPHSDGHSVFEKELKRLGIVSQNTINKYKIESKPVNVNIYQCEDCNVEYRRKRALPNNGRNHRCQCKGRLIDRGKRLVSA